MELARAAQICANVCIESVARRRSVAMITLFYSFRFLLLLERLDGIDGKQKKVVVLMLCCELIGVLHSFVCMEAVARRRSVNMVTVLYRVVPKIRSIVKENGKFLN